MSVLRTGLLSHLLEIRQDGEPQLTDVAYTAEGALAVRPAMVYYAVIPEERECNS